jgi:hypothetical protein
MENVKSIPAGTQIITVKSTEKSQVFTEICSAMKDANACEGQRIVASAETMGKPQTVAAACEVMKNEIKAEAQQILAISKQTARKKD